MQKLITLLVFYLFQSSINAQCSINHDDEFNKMNDLEKRELKGKIQSVTYSHFVVINNFGEISKGKKECEQEILFNEDGSVNKITNYNLNGEIEDVDIYEYENGEKKFIRSYNKKGELGSTTAFIKEGLNIREELVGTNGSLNDQYFIRTYDKQGNMIKEVCKYHKDPKVSEITEFYYDKHNRVIKYIENADDIFIITYKDNSSKYFVKSERYDPVTKKMEIQDRLEFNSLGSIIKSYWHNELSQSYEYMYDKNDNWIRQIIFKTEAKLPYQIIERKIIYFE